MQFSYTATNNKGETIKGDLEAKDKGDLYSQLKAQDQTLIRAEQKHSDKNIFSGLSSLLESVKEEEKIALLRNLGAMIGAGLSVSRALSVMGRQTRKKKLKNILSSVEGEIRKGGTLSDGFKHFPKVFSPLVISMVHAGEESGGLSESLKTVSVQMERVYRLRKKIRGAMVYPGIIVSAMVLVGILMLVFVVPTLTSTFEELGIELPASTRLIIGLSNLLQNHALLSLGGLIVLVSGVVLTLRTKKGKQAFEFVVLKTPLIGELVRETYSARTASTLSALLSSGVEVVYALDITRGTIQNSYYKAVLLNASQAVQKGEQISETFKKHEHLYPPFVGEMIAVGEETGKLSDLLAQVAHFYEEDVEQRTKDLSTVIEPILMVIVGVVVGFFAVSMITPMYSLTAGL